MRGLLYFMPAPGVLIRDPRTQQYVPPEGAYVPRNNYWLRLIARGEGVQGQPPAPAPPAAAPAKSAPPAKKKTEEGA